MSLYQQKSKNSSACTTPLFLIIIFIIVLCGRQSSCLAFIAYENPSEKTEKSSQKTTESAPSSEVTQEKEILHRNVFIRKWQNYMGEESPYRSVVITIVTLLILINLKAYLTKLIHKYLKENAFHEENTKSFLKIWNMVWKFFIAILMIIAMSGSLRLLGLTAGFFGMMLGWSLQQPVTGIAAWLMIILKKPFKVGDRVVIAGYTGDVTAISLTHVILNQVGGSVVGEERSGRGILIPNAILFQNTIVNYTLDQEYMLDEVLIRLTFDSDWDEAKRLMIEAATEATQDIIEKTGMQPFIRAELIDWGILTRLRFNTIPVRRQEISTQIIENVFRAFRRAYPHIRLAIPSTTIRYRPDWPLVEEKVREALSSDEMAEKSINEGK